MTTPSYFIAGLILGAMGGAGIGWALRDLLARRQPPPDYSIHLGDRKKRKR